MKNIDKIKQMSVDEMANFFCSDKCQYCIYNHKSCIEIEVDCVVGTIKWLESESEK